MRLFGYYVFHSFKNQLKKLFKTWVLIFILACVLFGGLIGVGAAMLSEAIEEENPNDTNIEEDIGDIEEEIEMTPEEIAEVYEVVELIVGALILVFFIFQVLGAEKNGSTIFMPADVNLLFASPMKPQSVLLFRLMTQLGTILVSSAYFAFQLPNLILNLGLSTWSAIGIIVTWIFFIVFGRLIQIFFYTIASTHTNIKKHLRKGIYAFVGILAILYLLFTNLSGLDYYASAKALFNHDISRFIPIWGWLKGFCMFALEENLVGTLISLVAIIVGIIAFIFIIWNIKADFYEDAMAKSEETAELLEATQETGFAKKKKDRSEKLRRDGMKYGWGANVFFFRSMYNRFRFAHFGIFTKTTETYFVIAVGICAFCKFVIDTDATLPIILTLSGFTFFRTLGNPLMEDTSKDFFRLIPESTMMKLFYSTLAGATNCFLDILPALLVTIVLGVGNPLSIIAWIPFILSIDFYGTTVGTFIDISVPVNAGTILKQLVQILFIYFGLLPDIGIMAVGIIFGHVTLAAIGCALMNICFGTIFLILTPLFIDSK